MVVTSRRQVSFTLGKIRSQAVLCVSKEVVRDGSEVHDSH